MRRNAESDPYDVTCSADGLQWQVWCNGELRFAGSRSAVEDWLDWRENLEPHAVPNVDHARRDAGRHAMTAVAGILAYIGEFFRRSDRR
jgi:hypothetical protein